MTSIRKKRQICRDKFNHPKTADIFKVPVPVTPISENNSGGINSNGIGTSPLTDNLTTTRNNENSVSNTFV